MVSMLVATWQFSMITSAKVMWVKGALSSGVQRGGGFKPPPKFRSFDKAAFDCKLSRKCLVFLFQHPN